MIFVVIFAATMTMWAIVISLGLVLHQPLLVVGGVLGAVGTIILMIQENR